MSGEKLFHSFPRDRELRTLGRSLPILRSILNSGLLLVPEIVKYPAELRDPGDERDKIVSIQRRLSLTMLPVAELPGHCKHFGPIALGFSPLAARRLGALPVMYLPQATTSEPIAALDQLGYFFAYRIAELQQMCDRITHLREDIEQHSPSDVIEVTQRRGLDRVEVTSHTLKVLLDMIVGQNNVEEFSATLQSLASLFYPTDKFRHSAELVKSPLYYYYQREWRVLSGLVLHGIEIDAPLTQEEKAEVTALNRRFFCEMITLRHRQVRRIDACCIIRSLDGRPIRDLVESIHVPAKWLDATRDVLKEFSMTSHLQIVNVDCDSDGA